MTETSRLRSWGAGGSPAAICWTTCPHLSYMIALVFQSNVVTLADVAQWQSNGVPH